MKKITLIIGLTLIIQSMVLSQGCLSEGITFSTQEQIDNFQANYPGCTEIEGEVQIYSPISDITNLDGLSVLTFIGGALIIIDNDVLTSVAGLGGLTSIGGELLILDNNFLTSLEGLNNLNSIGGNLSLADNYALTNIDALLNIAGTSISNLTITENLALANCAIKSICDYLANPGGTIEIYGNGDGCNSTAEIETACEELSINDKVIEKAFSIYPNPATDKLFITSNNGLKIETVNIYNQLGQKVLYRNEIGESINISTLGQGIYIVELASSKLKIRLKLIIEQ